MARQHRRISHAHQNPGRALLKIVADEIVRVVGLPAGQRPRRTVADGFDYGAEITNGAAEEPRLRLARRMDLTGLPQHA
ncbi:hypothetical protein ACSDR0_48405 [Streptosporangium sp. G11]|uniref:hypothetical protein n=1 Tax=Streptosporangium sp. G11 TaxID=3436926 RepID=UPI003EBA19F0